VDSSLPSTYASAEPSLAEIEKQIDEAREKLEPVIEQYNKVHSELQANLKRSADLVARSRPLQLQLDVAAARVGAKAVGQVVALRDRYEADRTNVDALIVQQKRQDAELAARKKVIQAEVDRLQKLRVRLGPPPSKSSLYIGNCPAVYVGGAAGTAVKTACAQIGKPYVWAAGGPDSFDCLGLTQEDPTFADDGPQRALRADDLRGNAFRAGAIDMRNLGRQGVDAQGAPSRSRCRQEAEEH